MTAVLVPTTLAALTRGLGSSTDEVEITDLTLDSRSAGPGSCFVALAGQQHGAHDFIEDAVNNGAAAVLFDSADRIAYQGVPKVAIRDLREKLELLARRFFGDASRELLTFAITGTNGKTSVAYMIAEAFHFRNQRCAYVGTLGHGELEGLGSSATTTPDILSLYRWLSNYAADGVAACALEASSHGLEQGRMAGISCDIVMFTNLGRDHLDYHQSSEAYRAAKEKIFSQPGIRAAVINIDDSTGQQIATRYGSQFDLWTCSSHSSAKSKARVRAESVVCSLDRTHFSIVCGAEEALVEANLVGRVNVDNLLMTAAALMASGWTITEAAAAVSTVHGPPGRLQSCGLDASKPTVFVDYAHTPDSLLATLQSLRELTRGKVILVFGCGGDRDKGKRPLMGQIARENSDRYVITSDNPRSEDPQEIASEIIGSNANSTAIVELDRRKAIEIALNAASASDVVLIAGKGHEQYQIIGDQRIAFNDIDVVRELGAGSA